MFNKRIKRKIARLKFQPCPNCGAKMDGDTNV